MKVLLSIKPVYAELILAGEKKFEFRRSIFKKNVNKVIIYATSPISKIIGEFSIENILVLHPKDLWEKTKKDAGITKEFFDNYFDQRNIGFAIKIKDPQKYITPIKLQDFLPNSLPPQSFRYL